MSNTVLEIKNLSFMYRDSSNNNAWKTVFENVNLSIEKRSIIGIAGESGCGKTTISKCILRDNDQIDLSHYKPDRSK